MSLPETLSIYVTIFFHVVAMLQITFCFYYLSKHYAEVNRTVYLTEILFIANTEKKFIIASNFLIIKILVCSRGHILMNLRSY